MPRIRVPILLLAIVIAVPLFFSLSGVADAQGDNLLVNPGFEGAYSSWVPNPPIPDCPAGICTTAQVPPGWAPWWVKERDSDGNPEYKPAAGYANRIHSGANAAQYFSFHRTHKAGLLQTVAVPANANLRFSVWGQAWSSDGDDGFSTNPSSVNMMIGIDPTGGGNVYGSSVIWSAVSNPYDAYAPFVVEARAQGSQVTVFMFSNPRWPVKHNDIYWDDASLVVTTGTATQPTSQAPAATRAPRATSTPDANGVSYWIVQSGDTLSYVASQTSATIEQIRVWNDIGSDNLIYVGQKLVVGGGSALPGPTATADSASDSPTATSTSDVTEEPTATPEATATTETTRPVTLCVLAFEDADNDGQHDGDEALKAGVALTVASTNGFSAEYVTDGLREPFCFDDLTTDEITISRAVDGETLTTPGKLTLALLPGETRTASFGSYLAAEGSDPTEVPTSADESDSEGSTLVDDPLALAAVVVGGIALLVILLVLGIIISRSRASR